MSDDLQQDSAPRDPVSGSETRLPYVQPRLERLGDVRSKTLGPTFGVGDSPQNKVRV